MIKPQLKKISHYKQNHKRPYTLRTRRPVRRSNVQTASCHARWFDIGTGTAITRPTKRYATQSGGFNRTSFFSRDKGNTPLHRGVPTLAAKAVVSRHTPMKGRVSF